MEVIARLEFAYKDTQATVAVVEPYTPQTDRNYA